MDYVLDIGDIIQILPHRYPFLLLDGVTKLEARKCAEGVKSFTINEWFFQGHFPGKPIVSGVLIVEALAQLTAIMYCADSYLSRKEGECVADNVGYLANISDLRLKRTVEPGQQLILYTELIEQFNNVLKVKVKATTKDRGIVAQGTLVVTQNNNNTK